MWPQQRELQGNSRNKNSIQPNSVANSHLGILLLCKPILHLGRFSPPTLKNYLGIRMVWRHCRSLWAGVRIWLHDSNKPVRSESTPIGWPLREKLWRCNMWCSRSIRWLLLILWVGSHEGKCRSSAIANWTRIGIVVKRVGSEYYATATKITTCMADGLVVVQSQRDARAAAMVRQRLQPNLLVPLPPKNRF